MGSGGGAAAAADGADAFAGTASAGEASAASASSVRSCAICLTSDIGVEKLEMECCAAAVHAECFSKLCQLRCTRKCVRARPRCGARAIGDRGTPHVAPAASPQGVLRLPAAADGSAA
jgi:hypothetical protein